MSEIKIKTLTPVHIGSGRILQNGIDYVFGQDAEGSIIGIVSPEKVLNIIGQQNINKWVASIDRRESISKFLSNLGKKVDVQDYAKRIIIDWTNNRNNTTTLNEQLLDGRGIPYISGSSIKGAIRTCILSSLAEQGCESDVQWFTKSNKPNKTPAKNVEAKLFGNDPKEDVFRFLHVGDAYFGEKYNTVAVKMVNINERPHGGYWDDSKPQVIEAISSEDTSYFNLHLDTAGHKLASGRGYVKQLPTCMQSVGGMFKTINEHTLRLLNSEKKYWEDRPQNYDGYDKVEKYISQLENIKTDVGNCKRGECVMRIGHGSGWRFITGAWTECFSDEGWEKLKRASRPNNDKYGDFNFPKSRRVDEECTPLGFVKMTIM